MNFRDRWATDENGEQILFTVEMQRQLSHAGLPVEPAALKQLGSQSRTQSVSSAPPRREPVYSPPARSVEPEPRDTSPSSTGEGEEFEVPATIQIDAQTGKYIGRMKWYNVKKGYGFIIRGAGEEIFFHKSNAAADPEQMEEGQWVLYDVEETRKGPEATDIEPYTGDVNLLDWN